MSLFHRRSLREMINTCSAFLSAEQTKLVIEKLNRNDEQSLQVQWELAVLFGLSKTGTVAHEMTFGRRKPDIHWSHSASACSIVADIRTVSDAGLEEENPREFYRLELRRRVRALGFDPDHFSDYPVGIRVGPPGNQKMRLLYPKVSECNRLFGSGRYRTAGYVRSLSQLPIVHSSSSSFSAICFWFSPSWIRRLLRCCPRREALTPR